MTSGRSYLFSWRCSIFQSGLRSPIKITDIFFLLLLLFHILIQAAERKNKCEGASMGFLSRESKNSDSDYPRNYLIFFLFFPKTSVPNPFMQIESFLHLKLLFTNQPNRMFQTLYSSSNPDTGGLGSRNERLAKPRAHLVHCTSED